VTKNQRHGKQKLNYSEDKGWLERLVCIDEEQVGHLDDKTRRRVMSEREKGLSKQT
jgi:hypothetical protein